MKKIYLRQRLEYLSDMFFQYSKRDKSRQTDTDFCPAVAVMFGQLHKRPYLMITKDKSPKASCVSITSSGKNLLVIFYVLFWLYCTLNTHMHQCGYSGKLFFFYDFIIFYKPVRLNLKKKIDPNKIVSYTFSFFVCYIIFSFCLSQIG